MKENHPPERRRESGTHRHTFNGKSVRVMSELQQPPVDLLQGAHHLKDVQGGSWTFQNAQLHVLFPGFTKEQSYVDATIRNHEILLYRDTEPGYMERLQLRSGQNGTVFAELRVNETMNDFKGLWELISPYLLQRID